MTVEGDIVRMTHGPSENGVRPAIDPLFRSAARSFGPRVIGIVLTGSLDDGTAGLLAVKQAGGVAVVQDPDDAFAPSMPRSAMNAGPVDHVLPIGEIGPMIDALVRERAPRHNLADGSAVQSMESDPGAEALAVHVEDRPATSRSSRVRSAAAACGNPKRQVCFGSAAASATSIRPTAWWRRRPTR